MSLNIGNSFENWIANNSNYNKMLQNKHVDDFSFVNKDISKLKTSEKADYYQKEVLNLAQSRISNYDTNNNKKMEFIEYVQEQVNIYKKTFNEEIDLNIKGMKELLENTFKACDTNKDGSIDNKEMSAVFAYMDASSNEGKLDGKISYKSAMTTNWLHPDMPEVLKNLKSFIFGNK